MISSTVDAQLSSPRQPPNGPDPDVGARSRGWVWLVALLVLGGIGAAAYFLLPKWIHANSAQGASAAAGRPVPVVAATAISGDMDLYLTGLGSVVPLNTVVVRSRVDGQIMKVYYTEGQSIRENEPLVEIDPRPFNVQLEQAQGQLLKDQAQLANAQRDLQRLQSIPQSVTPQQIDTQTALVSQYEGAVKSDEAQVHNAQLQLTYCHVTAPISGRIGLRLVDEGNMVHAADPNGLAVITQIQPITVIFTIPEDDIWRVVRQPNLGEGLDVEALDRTAQTELARGSLLAVDNTVDPNTGTVRLKAIFQNDNNALFPSEFVNARLKWNTLRTVVIVPAAAVQHGPDSTFIYVVQPDQTVAMKNVTLGPTEGDQTVIEKGVTSGEVVVTDGVDRLQPGSHVTVRRQAVHPATTHPAASTRPATMPMTRPATRPTTLLSVPGTGLRPARGRK